MFYGSETFAKQGKHIIYLIQSQCLLTLFKLSYKPESYPGSLCQFNLRKPVLLPFLLNIFR